MGTVILTLFIFLLVIGSIAFLVLHKIAKNINKKTEALAEAARLAKEAEAKRLAEEEEENRRLQEIADERRRRRQEELRKAQEAAAQARSEARKVALEQAKLAEEQARLVQEQQLIDNEIKNARYSVYNENSPIKRKRKTTKEDLR